MTTGAHVVIDRLIAGEVDVCFANPGTSEMHFVAALDSAPQMRAVLCLFEGVVTGAADGYARIAGKPAATLLHLGPGMANGLANLHNARRAHSPVVNVVGDHATYHQRLDAPLQSDIDVLGHWLTGTVHRPGSTAELSATVDRAIASANLGRIATLVLPADLSWGDAQADASPSAPLTDREREIVQLLSQGHSIREVAEQLTVSTRTVEGHVYRVMTKLGPRSEWATGTRESADVDVAGAAELLKTYGEKAVLLLGGPTTAASGLRAAARISAATGSRVLVETFPARLARGRGVPDIARLGYFAEMAQEQLRGARHLILAGARSPVAFFAYPNLPGDLVPSGAKVHTVPASRLADVADRLAAPAFVESPSSPTQLPSGPLRSDNWASVIGALLPDNAIISDEANTSGLLLPDATAASPPHDVLTLTGGAIGQGLPVAVGAAIAAPHRPVVALQSDGSAMYTISALWTMARERLDITVVILNNRAYAILQLELQRVGATAGGPKAQSLLDLSNPNLDFVAIADGFGVRATRATTVEELATQFSAAIAEPGPHLIDAVLAR
ncbi:acetolactate synthase-1/2/3 large subunit [Mycobacterium sp. OAS707]|uniref:acetolactate synthase large subunit n=1 Tax=Mycobacterium sp. OAS707 TaxID=2663822 RepID=UPI001789723F|nr:acetolactate synthase-1/2/3 large subunit [Mycobacterium sp. OAS707]